jgi:hypothetical protein
VAGALIQVASFTAAGGLGSDRLASMGPHGWRVGLFATIVLTAGGLIGAAAVRTLSGSTVDRGRGVSTVDRRRRADAVDRGRGADATDRNTQGRGHPADTHALRDPLPGSPGWPY